MLSADYNDEQNILNLERYSRTAEQKIVIRYRDIGVLGAFAEEARKIAV